MKKLLFLIALCVGLASASYAQTQPVEYAFAKSQYGKTTDTVTNATTKNLSLPVSGYQTSVTVQVNLTKVSGTAAGVVRLFGSVDGVTYVRINPTDSLIVSNVTSQSKSFVTTGWHYSFVRAQLAGTGTQVTKIRALVLPRHP